MPKPLKLLYAQLKMANDLLRGKSARHYRVYRVTSDGHRSQAKALHAQAYLYKGFIYDRDLDDRGFISHTADPHQLHAEYFVACELLEDSEAVRVTARQITAHPTKAFNSFPILTQAHIEEHYREQLQGYQPNEIIEISGLAKGRGVPTAATFLVYRAMWSYSKHHNHKIWLMACSPSLYRRLKQFVGPAIHQIGEPSEYTGELVIPAMVDIAQAENQLARYARSALPTQRYISRAVLRFFLQGETVHDSGAVSETLA